jgi:GT2 family glycosyltransferase
MITKIAVLITCHNRKEKTLACLHSLFECNLPECYLLDVFLVDDGSSDGTGDTVKSEFPTINVINGNGNLFWNRGMHLAWETAAKSTNFDFYIWLNDDVELFVNSILDIIFTCPEYDCIVVGFMRSKNEETTSYGGRNSKGDLLIPSGSPQICHVVNGNFVLVPVSVYNQIGNLDPLFPHTMGDYDYALRANKIGIKSITTPDFIGFCEKNESLPQWCLTNVPFLKRVKSLYSPLGNSHPYYYFQFSFRHFGMLVAIKHLFSIHLRLLYPGLWKN